MSLHDRKAAAAIWLTSLRDNTRVFCFIDELNPQYQCQHASLVVDRKGRVQVLVTELLLICSFTTHSCEASLKRTLLLKYIDQRQKVSVLYSAWSLCWHATTHRIVTNSSLEVGMQWIRNFLIMFQRYKIIYLIPYRSWGPTTGHGLGGEFSRCFVHDHIQ